MVLTHFSANVHTVCVCMYVCVFLVFATAAFY